MKSELIHLLQKLKADHPDFQNLVIASNGVCFATLRHGVRRFETLDALEAYAWLQPDASDQLPVANLQSPITNPPEPITSGFLQTNLPTA